MTSYSIDVQDRSLLRTWETRRERLAAVVLELPASHAPEDRQGLAAALTHLSEGLWRSYARSGFDLGSGAARGRRRRLLDLLARVRAAVRPSSAGTLASAQLAPIDRYVIGLAEGVTAALLHLDDPEAQETIMREVEEETAAADRADRGLLTGRAAQATLITRAFVLPSHLQKADTRFRDRVLGDLLGSGPLVSRGPGVLEDVDLTAAAAAGVHWVKASLDVLAEVAGRPLEDAVMIADDYQRTSAALLRSVVRSVDLGNSPQAVTTMLVSSALHSADGADSSVQAIQERVTDVADETASDVGLDAAKVILSQLDLRRPAESLLQATLEGIDACRAAYDLYVGQPALPADFDSLAPDEQEALTAERFMSVGAALTEAVRERAVRDQARLL